MNLVNLERVSKAYGVRPLLTQVSLGLGAGQRIGVVGRNGDGKSTLLALGNTFYHWGGVIVPPGYADPIQFKTGNPYGTSHVSGDGPPDEVVLEAARFQARRVVDTAAALKAGRV